MPENYGLQSTCRVRLCGYDQSKERQPGYDRERVTGCRCTRQRACQRRGGYNPRLGITRYRGSVPEAASEAVLGISGSSAKGGKAITRGGRGFSFSKISALGGSCANVSRTMYASRLESYPSCAATAWNSSLRVIEVFNSSVRDCRNSSYGVNRNSSTKLHSNFL